MIRFSVKGVKKDTRQWERMKKNLLKGISRSVDVGWWDSTHTSGYPVAQIAKWNEEGHMNGGAFQGTYTPPRPFIRVGFLPHVRSKIVPKYFQHINSVALGNMTWTGFNTMLGKELVNAMKEIILSWDTPSNSPVTIKLKGFNDPLLETGNMYDSVKSRIARKGN